MGLLVPRQRHQGDLRGGDEAAREDIQLRLGNPGRLHEQLHGGGGVRAQEDRAPVPQGRGGQRGADRGHGGWTGPRGNVQEVPLQGKALHEPEVLE